MLAMTGAIQGKCTEQGHTTIERSYDDAGKHLLQVACASH